jgi:hypothetical protein
MDDSKHQKAKNDIEKITTPDTLKRNLINASLILTAFELMKTSIIDQVRDFFTSGEDEHRREIDKIRKELPKEFHNHPLIVYAHWFREQEALNKADIDNVVRIWQYRNKLAHELIAFLVDSDFEVDVKYLYEIRDLVGKVDVWWLREVEIPVNPDFDQVEVKDSDIQSGRMIIINHLLSVALDLPPVAGPKDSNLVH